MRENKNKKVQTLILRKADISQQYELSREKIAYFRDKLLVK